jgi:alpha-methylacyl-CoA racemase
MTDAATGPLAGVRVLEMAGIGPAPFACLLLAQLGAEVLRVTRPQAGPAAHRGSAAHAFEEQGRASIAIDLKSAAGPARVLELVESADVLVEGFRPGVMERLGLGPDACLARNRALVYGRMTGWGQDGPLARTAGHDINYIAITGALHSIGPRGGKPVPPLNLVGDFGGGALYLALGVVSAVLHARRTGQGQVVDAAIVDGVLSMMAIVFGRWASGVWTDERGANLLDGGAPWYDTYETRDGKHVAFGAIEPQFFDEFCARTGLPLDAAQRTDRSRWPAIREQLHALFLTRTRDEWTQLLEGSDACVTPVLSLAEVAAHPQVVARGATADAAGIPQPAPAPRFSRTPSQRPVADESGVERAQRWRRAARG